MASLQQQTSRTSLQQPLCRRATLSGCTPARAWRQGDSCRRPARHAPQALPGDVQLLATLAELASSSEFGVDTFEPQLRPEIMAAAGFAALPPILFWGRIAASALRRQKQIDDEKAAEELRQQEREELKRKITGQSNNL